mgnify:CR=1 FL=1
MRDKKRVNRITIQKMIDYCDRVEILIDRFGGTLEKFESDFAFQMSCGMCILQIGELTTRLTEEFKAQHSEIPWNKIKATRNIHVHDYDSVRFDLIWEILTEDIPALKKSLEEILEPAEN